MVIKSSFLAGSNHKTGTVWMAQILGDFCRETGRTFFAEGNVDKDRFKEVPAIIFDNNSTFDNVQDIIEGMVGFTIIRHPKDQIISATRYHHTATEGWLNIPENKFGGMTYQQKINSIDGWEQKVIFEMKNASLLHTYNQIHHDSRLMRIKYEDLINEYPSPKIFDQLFDLIKLDTEDVDIFMKNYLKNHIKSGYKNKHIIDGSVNQRDRLWTDRCERVYQRIYGDIASQLGYN